MHPAQRMALVFRGPPLAFQAKHPTQVEAITGLEDEGDLAMAPGKASVVEKQWARWGSGPSDSGMDTGSFEFAAEDPAQP